MHNLALPVVSTKRVSNLFMLHAACRRGKGTGISNSVLITGFYDFQPNWNGKTTCQAVIDNAKGLSAKKINIVVTVFAVGSWSNLKRCAVNLDARGRGAQHR